MATALSQGQAPISEAFIMCLDRFRRTHVLGSRHKYKTRTALAACLFVGGFQLSMRAGQFLQAVNYPAGIAPIAVVVADFNGDSIPDLAIANQGGVYVE